jgi:hypothetical protein
LEKVTQDERQTELMIIAQNDGEFKKFVRGGYTLV